jgi:hypothetical protein
VSVVELGLQEPLGGICDAVVKQKIKAIALPRGKVPPGIVTLVSVVKRVSLNTVELDEFTIEKKMLFAPGVAFGLTSIAEVQCNRIGGVQALESTERRSRKLGCVGIAVASIVDDKFGWPHRAAREVECIIAVRKVALQPNEGGI